MSGAFALQHVVAVPNACFGERRAAECLGDDQVLGLTDALRHVEHLRFALEWHDNHAIVVANHQVTGPDPHVAERDRHIHRPDLNAVLPGPHEAAAAIDRVVNLKSTGDVPTDAVDRGARHASVAGYGGEDIAPHG